MTDRQTLALRAVALAEVLKRVKAADVTVRADLAQHMPVGGREPVRIPGPYGEVKVGSVTYAEGAVSAAVTNEAALTQWVRDNRPDELVETRTVAVRGSFRDWLLGQAKKDGIAVDGNGEPIPGITVRFGDPYITVRQEKDVEAVGALIAAIHSDPFALRSLLELEPGDES